MNDVLIRWTEQSVAFTGWGWLTLFIILGALTRDR